MSTPLLSAENLVCHRGGRALFAPQDIKLEPGALIILRGPNGSGKTTLLRALAGLLPAEGKITRAAQPCYVGHRGALHDELNLHDHLSFWKSLCRQPRKVAFQNVLRAMALGNMQRRRAGTLSAGQRQRLSLCRLLLEDSLLWLLDEPSAALDVQGMAYLSALISAQRKRGGGAVIASHGGSFENASTLNLGAAR
ncbi:MAG: heme ABC exporter ATP-binding protein CcmA [Proteobacteria bacterium]|nr:heme ABC exporter ATP-binding protein CcmA [Pseudomonadota bacterium]